MDDPFGLLGLSPDADERAIKRGYAKQLKTTRPEEDPEGFARLVAARDEAIRLARRREEAAEAAAAFGNRPIDVEALARLAAAFPMTANQATETPPTSPEGPTPTEAPEPRVAATAANDAAAPPDSSAPAAPAVSTLVDPAPALTQDDAVRPPADAPLRKPRPTRAKTAATAVDPLREALALARALLRSPTAAELCRWTPVFAVADQLPLALRGRFEHLMAEALNQALPSLLAAPDIGEPGAMALVERIGEEFGWLGATRRVAGLFWPPDGRQPLPALLERMLSRVPPQRYDENALPVIEPFDRDAFFGGPEHRSVLLYERGRRRGRFGWSWNNVAFVSPVGWLAQEGWYGAATVAIVIGMAAAMQLPQAGDDLSKTPALFGFCMLFLFHAVPALIGDRLLLWRFLRHRRGADRTSLYRDEARRRFLAEKSKRDAGAVILATGFAFMLTDLAAVSLLVDAASAAWPGLTGG